MIIQAEKKNKEKNQSPPSSHFIDIVHTIVVGYVNIPLGIVSPLTVRIIHFQASRHWLGACVWAVGTEATPEPNATQESVLEPIHSFLHSANVY